MFSDIVTVEGEDEFELHPQDGWFNNLIHPDWGAIGRKSIMWLLIQYNYFQLK